MNFHIFLLRACSSKGVRNIYVFKVENVQKKVCSAYFKEDGIFEEIWILLFSKTVH